ncbi:MAG: hypothetical protein LPK45_10390, partial [Bacteroidota bacterium]|nr:hypothetical protein [Bacteroidota bacterium]MDX5431504.1 hypothetical protein [Bacteroidota bacterium]MDX5470228.1 hypothetical protein [Bacteroidota bacterium]
VELLLIGAQVDSAAIEHIQRRLPYYQLEEVQLIVKQGQTPMNNDDGDMSITLMQTMLRDKDLQISQRDSQLYLLKEALENLQKDDYPTQGILKEMQAQGYPATRLGLSNMNTQNPYGDSPEAVCAAWIEVTRELDYTEKERLSAWLRVRTESTKLEIFYKVKENP